MENALSTIIPQYVESCLFVYRTTFNRAINETPYYLMYGRDPIMPQDLLIPFKERQNLAIRAADLDIYKTRLLPVRLTILSIIIKNNIKTNIKNTTIKIKNPFHLI
jgi:hypothetical protein